MAHDMVVPVLRERMQALDLDDELPVLILGPHLVIPIGEDVFAVAWLDLQERRQLLRHAHEAVFAVLGFTEVDHAGVEVEIGHSPTMGEWNALSWTDNLGMFLRASRRRDLRAQSFRNSARKRVEKSIFQKNI